MTRRGAILLWAVATWGACLELEELELGRCGNGVLETGEDCDTYAQAPGGDACLPAGAAGECRYSCAEGQDGKRLNCPDGYDCGRDGICRRHSGENGAVNPTGQAAGTWLGAGDVDGDGNDDVINLSRSQLSVDFVEDGAYRESHRLPITSLGLPLVEHLDDDAFVDIALPTDIGLAVWRGSGTRTLLPTTYASLSVELTRFKFVPVDIAPDVPLIPAPPDVVYVPGDEPLTLTEFGAFPLRSTIEYGVDFAEIGDNAFSFPVNDAVGDPIAGRFDETADVHGAYHESPEQIAMALPTEIHVYRPSYFARDAALYYLVDATVEAEPNPTEPGVAPDPMVPPSHPGRTTISVPGTVGAAPSALQINAATSTPGLSNINCGAAMAVSDEHLDLLVLSSTGILAAFGTGDGHFHSDPCELDEIAAMTVTPDDAATVPAAWADCMEAPLAAGDIDGDGGIDMVTASAVHLSGRIPVPLAADYDLCDEVSAVPHPDGDDNWKRAVLGDFNGDGRRDVLAANEGGGLDLLLSSAGSHLNLKRIATAGPADLLTADDYDGNGVDDLVFAEPREGVDDLLYAIFGEPGAFLGTPVLLGGLAEIRYLVSLDLAEKDAPAVDDMADLVVGTTDPENESTLRFALLFGRADRQLGAPFVFAEDVAENVGATERYTPVGVTAAEFGLGCDEGGGSARALVMTGTARREFPTPVDEPETILGAACIGDDADFDPINNTDPGGLPLGPDRIKNTTATAVRLSAGAPEPIIIGWRDDFASGPSIDLAAPIPVQDEGQLAWTLGELATIDGAVPAHTLGPEPASLLWRWSPSLSNGGLACRFGAGEDETLVFLAMHVDGECEANKPRARTILHVIPAVVLEGIRSGGSLDDALEVTGEDGETILGFACLNADEDPADELAFVTLDDWDDQCNEKAPAQARRVTVHIVQMGADGQLEPRRTYEDLTGKDLPYLDQPFADIPPVSGLARGDFNGDGVDDLALGAFPSSVLLLGRPVNP